MVRNERHAIILVYGVILHNLQVVAAIDMVDDGVLGRYITIIGRVEVGQALGCSFTGIVHIALDYIQCHIVRLDVQIACKEYRVRIPIFIEVFRNELHTLDLRLCNLVVEVGIYVVELYARWLVLK